MTRQEAVLIADAAGLSIFALGRDREKFLLALEIFTAMVEAAERKKSEDQIETLSMMYRQACAYHPISSMEKPNETR